MIRRRRAPLGALLRRDGGTLGLGLALLLALACAPDPSEPPAITWGADICDHCRMIVSDERHAAAARSADGAEVRFDDPGCLALFLDTQEDEAAWRAWGHDETGRWRPIDELLWVEAAPEATPMGSGLLGYSPAASDALEGSPWPEAARRSLSRAD